MPLLPRHPDSTLVPGAVNTGRVLLVPRGVSLLKQHVGSSQSGRLCAAWGERLFLSSFKTGLMKRPPVCVSRYDEWIKADKIVRPANKNVPKIKHRKKIKVGRHSGRAAGLRAVVLRRVTDCSLLTEQK